MLKSFLSCKSLGRLIDELVYKFDSLFGNLVPFFAIKIGSSLKDHVMNGYVIRAIKWCWSSKKDIQDAPSWPKITLQAIATIDNLRRHI